MKRKRILTGLQPTNKAPHIGNYIGALLPLLTLQNQGHEIIVFIANMHAITTTMDNIKYNSLYMAAVFLACGLDSKDTHIFNQHELGGYHSYLSWIFSCICSRGKLNRMVQMKDKSKQYGDMMGIYQYPLLMAADILLYNPDYVPVGDDQKQHLELTQDLCVILNRILYNKKSELAFKIPEEFKDMECKKIMSLGDGLKKMSKSDIPKNCIFLDDTDQAIEKKIMSAKTDNMFFPDSEENIQTFRRVEINNLINIYGIFSNISRQEVILQFKNKPTINFKKALIGVLQSNLTPIRNKIDFYMANTHLISQKLQEGKQYLEPQCKEIIDKLSHTLF